MPEVVLHIGLPKTGTTYLQGWLRVNRQRILSQGAFTLPLMDAHRLAAENIEESQRANRPDIDTILRTGLQASTEPLLNAESRGGSERVLVSSEYFFMSDPERVAAFFRAYGATVTTIICFVRRQDRFLASGYNQSVKRSGQSLPPPAPIYRRAHDWSLFLASWEAAFPGSELKVRNFDYHRQRDTVLRALMEDAGIAGIRNDRSPPSKSANDSLSAEMVEIVRLANRSKHDSISDLALEAQRAGIGATPFRFSDDAVEKMRVAFQSSNAQLARFMRADELEGFTAPDWRTDPGADFTDRLPARTVVDFLLFALARQPESRTDKPENPPS